MTILRANLDRKWMATAFSNGDVGLWRIHAGYTKKVATLSHDGEVTLVHFAPKADSMLIGTSAGQLTLYELAEAPVVRRRFYGHSAEILSAQFGHERWLVSSSTDRALLWDLRELQGPIEIVADTSMDAVAFDSNARWLASGGRNGEVVLWRIEPMGTLSAPWTVGTHDDHVISIAFTSGGEQLLTSSRDGAVVVWPLSTCRSGKPCQGITLGRHDGAAKGILFPVDERFAVTAGDDGAVVFWPLHVRELMAVACSRIGRNLTAQEWREHFVAPYRTTCSPGLAEVARSHP